MQNAAEIVPGMRHDQNVDVICRDNKLTEIISVFVEVSQRTHDNIAASRK